MDIDDAINTAYKCLKALRFAEKQTGYPGATHQRLEEAEAYLTILQKESPLMYRILNEEYIDVWQRCYHEHKIIEIKRK